MGSSFTLHTEFDLLRCKTCGLEYMIPSGFHQALRQSKAWWHCPNGHQWHYSESTEDKLRRERDRMAQQLAQKDDEIKEVRAANGRAWELLAAEERRVRAAKGQITKLKKRASNGVCPCCNRTFSDLARHMHSKHPGFVTEPDAAEAVTVN